MDSPGDPEGPRPPGGDGPPGGARETSRQLSREQIFVLISAASINLGSMMCYSILGPFFPKEAEKKGASNTVIGMIFGCYAFFNLLASLVFGKYLVHIGAKFMFVAGMFVSGGVTVLFGVLDQVPEGPVFIAMCFLVRIIDAISFAAAITASSSILAKAFPNNVATVMSLIQGNTHSGNSSFYPRLPLYPSSLPHSAQVLASLILRCPSLFWRSLIYQLDMWDWYSWVWHYPTPFLHHWWAYSVIKCHQLWLLVLILVINGTSAGMSLISTFPEILSCAHENGFEEGLSTLGLVSGLFGALWSVGAFVGPTLGGFLYEKIGFEWAAALQGLWALTSGLVMGLFYLLEHSRRRRRSKLQNSLGTEEERTALLPDEM
ncbi:MFS-type transporter SLC18B1 isoform X5 [Monodon monoceros]|uniref:MFS-type transporter SLC18B1 isoform X5 n=1 Tax=Monodon monoceros TaxID=40151 RepID=UPI0010F4EC82|nr:MFS-type transporter SLC18B1 isoform X5 [Monodon monoceros]